MGWRIEEGDGREGGARYVWRIEGHMGGKEVDK